MAGETVLVKTSNVRGAVSVYHTDKFCNHVLRASEVVEKPLGDVEDFLRECADCSGDHDRYFGQCRSCDAQLDVAGTCPFCSKFEAVMAE